MLKPPADDGNISVAVNTSIGEQLLIDIEARARTIYPDHAGSREQYIREKVAAKITSLYNDVNELQFRLDSISH